MFSDDRWVIAGVLCVMCVCSAIKSWKDEHTALQATHADRHTHFVSTPPELH